jgi:hypothetical protein
MLNITRVLSKLSLYEGIRASINEDPAHLRSAAQICVLNMLLRSTDSGVIHTWLEVTLFLSKCSCLRDLLHLLEACTRGGTHVYAELLREHTTATVSR